MSLIVHKYGGTSMGSVERIKNVARRVAKWHAAGHQVVVVPSAMAGETNRLLGLARDISPQADGRELDMIAATGEQASSALLAIALQDLGVPARSYTGWQVPVQTDSSYTKARITGIDDARIRADLDAGRVDEVQVADQIGAGCAVAGNRGNRAVGGGLSGNPGQRDFFKVVTDQFLYVQHGVT